MTDLQLLSEVSSNQHRHECHADFPGWNDYTAFNKSFKKNRVNKFDFVLDFLQFTQCLLVAINKPHRYNSTSIFDHPSLLEFIRVTCKNFK